MELSRAFVSQNFDVNKDGAVSSSEQAAGEAWATRVDTSGDGAIDVLELQSANTSAVMPEGVSLAAGLTSPSDLITRVGANGAATGADTQRVQAALGLAIQSSPDSTAAQNARFTLGSILFGEAQAAGGDRGRYLTASRLFAETYRREPTDVESWRNAVFASSSAVRSSENDGQVVVPLLLLNGLLSTEQPEGADAILAEFGIVREGVRGLAADVARPGTVHQGEGVREVPGFHYIFRADGQAEIAAVPDSVSGHHQD
ncbi:MAG: hypothetical protein AAF654_09720 [Myxococcota bacterium]